jgi:hypothetical protein
VIRYFSTKGKHKAVIDAVMRGRECYTIGDNLKLKMDQQLEAADTDFESAPPKALADIHISVATIKASRSDQTKFRILYGRKKELQFRAEVRRTPIFDTVDCGLSLCKRARCCAGAKAPNRVCTSLPPSHGHVIRVGRGTASRVIGSPCLGVCTHCDPIMW